jgi:hypothetical protein
MSVLLSGTETWKRSGFTAQLPLDDQLLGAAAPSKVIDTVP